MKLCIIGPEKRTKGDIKLIELAKETFEKVLYVPYSKISLSIEERTTASYKGIDLGTFDAILPRIDKSRNLFGYLLFNTIKTYTPILPRAYFITTDRFLMMDILKKEGIAVPNIYFVDSTATATKLLDQIEYPYSFRVSETERGITFAKSKKEAKSIMDTFGSFNKPIYMEEFFDSSYYQAIVIGGKVAGAIERKPIEKSDIFFSKGKPKQTKLSSSMKTLAISAANAIGATFAMVEMVRKPKQCVININLAPDIGKIMEITGSKIDKELINYIYSLGQMTKKTEISWIKSFFDDAKSRVKNVGSDR